MNTFLSKFPSFWEIVEVPFMCFIIALHSYDNSNYGFMISWLSLGIFRAVVNYKSATQSKETKETN